MTDLQLTPIGTSPAWYNVGEACSGFLIVGGGERILLDCGSGVVSRYLELFGSEPTIDAIVISHVHADHCSDLVPLKYGIEQGTLGHWRPQLWLPPGARGRLTQLVGAWDQGFEFFESAYDVCEYDTGHPFDVGRFTVGALHVPHYIESCALRLELGDTSLGYTGDTGPTDELAPFLRGVDLLLSEAAFPLDGDLGTPCRGHITAREAGQLARDAHAHSLLLTHVPEHHGHDAAAAAAAEQFVDGPVVIARSGTCYDVARRLAAAGSGSVHQ